MERSGVDMVLGVKEAFIAELLNRNMICNFAPAYIPSVDLIPSNSRGEVLLRFLTAEFALSTEIYRGNLRVHVDLREATEWLEDKLRPIAEASPYEFSLEMLENVLHVNQCGLKVGGENEDLVLFGVEFAEGAGADWDQFYTRFVGSELVGEGNEWGLFIKRHAVESVIRKIADDALAEMGGKDSENLRNMEIRNIEWPGDSIRLRGYGTYDMDCGIWGTAEIDFIWKAALTLHDSESKLSVQLRFYDGDCRGAEDCIQAFFCDFSWEDFVLGIFSFVISALVKILSAVFSDPSHATISKELIDLSWPQTGELRPSRPSITTDGVLIQGKGALEIGSSSIQTRSEILLEKTISPCFRPSETLNGQVLVVNSGDASLTICSAELEDKTYDPSEPYKGGWVILTSFSDSMPSIVLPGESTIIRVAYYPSLDAWFDQEYQATLVLHTVKKEVDSEGDASYSWEHVRVNLIAKYKCGHYDFTVRPDYMVVFPESVYLGALLDRLMKDIVVGMPWIDIPLPEGAIEILDIMTKDPVVSAIQILNSNEEIVVEIESSLPGKYMTVPLEKGQSFDFIARSEVERQTPVSLQGGEEEKIVKTSVECKKSVLIPAAKLSMKSPISHAALLAHWLFVATGRDILIYDVKDPSKPVKVYSKQMSRDVLSFDIARGQRTKSAGHLLVFLEGSRISPFELLGSATGKLNMHPLGEKAIDLDLKDPLKTFFYRSRCLVIGTHGLILFDIRDPEHFKLLSNIPVKARVYDVAIKRNLIFIGTDRGIEIVDLKQPESPKFKDTYKTESPVTHLEIRGPLLYATKEKGGTIVLECFLTKPLRQAGRYRTPYWKTKLYMDDDVSFSVSNDGKQLKLFTRQPLIADVSKLKRFPEREAGTGKGRGPEKAYPNVGEP